MPPDVDRKNSAPRCFSTRGIAPLPPPPPLLFCSCAPAARRRHTRLDSSLTAPHQPTESRFSPGSQVTIEAWISVSPPFSPLLFPTGTVPQRRHDGGSPARALQAKRN